MKYRSFLFLFVLFFPLVAGADIRMTGPEVSASATADPGRNNVVETYDQQGNLISTQHASYDLLVQAETDRNSPRQSLVDVSFWEGLSAGSRLLFLRRVCQCRAPVERFRSLASIFGVGDSGR